MFLRARSIPNSFSRFHRAPVGMLYCSDQYAFAGCSCSLPFMRSMMVGLDLRRMVLVGSLRSEDMTMERERQRERERERAQQPQESREKRRDEQLARACHPMAVAPYCWGPACSSSCSYLSFHQDHEVVEKAPLLSPSHLPSRSSVLIICSTKPKLQERTASA